MTVWNHQAVIQPRMGTVPDDVTGTEKAYKLFGFSAKFKSHVLSIMSGYTVRTGPEPMNSCRRPNLLSKEESWVFFFKHTMLRLILGHTAFIF